jgi:serine/threonine-protein kinase
VSESLRDQLQAALGEGHVIERELGGGGMSHVFLAHESALGRQVVVKVLLPELAAGVNVERFRREIKLAAQLQHPHIVPLLSAGEANGLPYFIMPYVAGESLRARIAREGELPIAETVRLLRDVVSALAYAHACGVVHRDVKPDNVLLSSGVAVVTDFGVAKAVSASASHGGGSNITSLGVALGTPAYMSPEQAAASPHADHRSDLYALGAMAYEMLTGMPPFTGRSPQAVLAAHVMEEAPPVERRRSAIPPALAVLVTECLAKSPADRPQTANEVMHALDAIATPSGGTAPTLVRMPSAGAAARGTPAPAWRLPAAIAAAALVLVAGGLLLRREKASPPVAAVAPPVRATTTLPPPDSTPGPATHPPAPPSPLPATESPSTPRGEQRLPAHAAAPRRKATAPPADTAATASPDTPASATAPADTPASAPAPTPAAVAPVAPAPLPAAGAPAPVAQPPAPPDPRPQIGAVVSQYAAAVESGSLAALKQVYPGMTSAQQRDWEQFFRLVRDVKADLSLGRLDVTNSAAEAQVAGTYTYLNTSTQRVEHQPVSFHASLRRDGGAWRIAQIR